MTQLQAALSLLRIKAFLLRKERKFPLFKKDKLRICSAAVTRIRNVRTTKKSPSFVPIWSNNKRIGNENDYEELSEIKDNNANI